jgi:SsrA-binding protein
MKNNISIKNKKAYFEYIILDEFVAGISLLGSEVKSIKNGAVSFTDAYCYINNNEVFLKNLHISEYKNASYNQHESKRDRKLLLTKKEIRKLKTKTAERGFAIMPLKLFVNDRGLIKLDIALAKGKKLYDKREFLKIKDAKRDLDRQMC